MKTTKTTLTRIIDGDTVVTQSSRFLFFRAPPLRIRLYGIDAPESEQKGGPESTRALKKIAARHGSTIYLTDFGKDKYGRTIGVISSGRNDPMSHYNLQMLREGQAHCYMLNGPFRAEYEAAERHAKKNHAGIWRDGKFERPADFRRKQEAAQAKRSSIKTKLILALAAVAAAAIAYYALADDVTRLFTSLLKPITG